MANYERIASRKARKYGLNPRIFRRQIRQEGFHRKVGPGDARDRPDHAHDRPLMGREPSTTGVRSARRSTPAT
jgi:hypothetical protein